MIDSPNPATEEMLSFRLDGALATALDRIARQDGASRSEILRRLLLAGVEREEQLTGRWIRRLRAIEGELAAVHELVEEAEADDAAEFLDLAVDAVARAIDELEDFEPEDD